MTLSLQNLRDSILTATSTDIEDWDNGNTDLDLFINKSWWDVMDQFDFREKEAPAIIFPTVAGTKSYDVSTITTPIIFDALQNIAIIDPVTLDHTNLDLITTNTFEDEASDDVSLQAKPTKYFRLGSKIYLYATPDSVYDIVIYYLQVLSDITSTPPIPQSWHEIIEFGANYRALLAKQEYQKANEIKKYQAILVNSRTPVKVKELTNTQTAGVEVMGRDY